MRERRFCIWLVIISTVFFACKGKKAAHHEDTLFTQIDDSGIDFANNITNTKEFNIFKYRNFYNGAGVAIGDINNDGLPDVFLTANMGANKLFLNKGSFKFSDISTQAGFKDKSNWSTGVSMVDINNDGWLDIYVCNAGYINGVAPKNQLFINNHNLTFTESAEQYGLTNDGGYCTHAAFFDYDLDGDLDCYILNNSFIPVNTLNFASKRELRAKDWPVADFLKGGGDKLLRNDKGHFTDVSEEAHIYGSLIGFGLGVTVGDVNNDHFPDIYVSNDFFERDYLYINNHDGTFSEQLEKRIQHISHSSMGADMGDLNNDGNPEIFVTEMLPADEVRFKTTASFENVDIQKLKENSGFYHQYMQNTLQLNNGNGSFSEIGFYSGVAATDWSWGGLMFDADNDGLNDLYVCNGIYNDLTDQDFIDFFANDIIQKMALSGQKEEIEEIIKKMPAIPIPNKAFRNKGNLHFDDVSDSWGLSTPSFSNGAAYADLDNDGDADLVVNNVNEPCFVFRNNSRQQLKNNFIKVKLKQNGDNQFAVGSKVIVFCGSEILSRELLPARGYQSSMDYTLMFGLGKKNVDSMRVCWPDGTCQTTVHPAINQLLTITKNSSAKPTTLFAKNEAITFDSVKTVFDKHAEDDHTDFYFERNVPELLSREGPGAAAGDVNGDKMDDIYIGGAAGQAGQLYLQTASGFMKSPQQVFNQFADFEDCASVFFDCDNDGDLDLVVGSGGNNRQTGSRELLNRLYKNDGRGNFTVETAAFVGELGMNTSVIAPNDFDGDGDVDLFVGSRSVPTSYGSTPISYLFVNDSKGHFTDIATPRKLKMFNAGMITGAEWTDVDGDHKKELVVTGEWMSPRIFKYEGEAFSEMTTNLENLRGWWQTVKATDIDGDGDDDLLLGNIGENFFLQPNAEAPVKLWIGDFDENSIADKIITHTVEGRDMPVFLKRDLTDQLPNLKKQNLRHVEYATKSIQDLIPEEELKKGIVKRFNYTSSVVAINNGKGEFAIKKLPDAVQMSSANAFAVTDVNGDGVNDIIVGGNRFGFLPQFCRIDASYGTVLLNDGKGNFSVQPNVKSGLNVRGQVSDIKIINHKQGKSILFLQNNDFPAMYQLHTKAKQFQ